MKGPPPMRALTRLAVVLAVVLAATSCNAKRSNISGTITRDGKALEWPSDGGLFLVIFVPEDRKPSQDPYLAETDRATGTYRIPEIRSGRYKVAIHQFDERHRDALENKYDPVK